MQIISALSQKKTSGILIKLQTVLLIILTNSLCVGAYELKEAELFDVMLAGGALHTCSSMSLKNCRVSDFGSTTKKSNLYAFSEQNAQRLLEIIQKMGLEDATTLQLHSALMKIYARHDSPYLDRNTFLDLIAEQNLPNGFIRGLSDTLYFALLDTHEVIQNDTNGRRKQEQANVAWTANPASQEIYRTFVDQAKLRVKDNNKPRIAVVTASSRDPFEVADFYLSVFDSLGADVVWLPLDASFQKARYLQQHSANGCERIDDIRNEYNSFERERIYPFRTNLQKQYCQQPALLQDILLNVQGIFFNGGDQSRTLAALTNPFGQPSDELRLIQKQVVNKALIVGGTSAGTAVQSGGFFNNSPVPMISSGQSDTAMQKGGFPIIAASQRCLDNCTNTITADDLTYKADGGTGLFTLGAVDTHFSERDREARLAVLTAESKQRFGFGVDETTAMLASFENDQAKIKVIGLNGVFMLDSAGGQHNITYELDGSINQRQLIGQASYLPSGSFAKFNYKQQQWQFVLHGESASTRKKLTQLDDGEWRNQTRQWCSAEKMVRWQLDNYSVVLHANEASRFSITKKHGVKHCGYTQWPYLIFTTSVDE